VKVKPGNRMRRSKKRKRMNFRWSSGIGKVLGRCCKEIKLVVATAGVYDSYVVMELFGLFRYLIIRPKV
jgi:hypothetical protein